MSNGFGAALHWSGSMVTPSGRSCASKPARAQHSTGVPDVQPSQLVPGLIVTKLPPVTGPKKNWPTRRKAARFQPEAPVGRLTTSPPAAASHRIAAAAAAAAAPGSAPSRHPGDVAQPAAAAPAAAPASDVRSPRIALASAAAAAPAAAPPAPAAAAAGSAPVAAALAAAPSSVAAAPDAAAVSRQVVRPQRCRPASECSLPPAHVGQAARLRASAMLQYLPAIVHSPCPAAGAAAGGPNPCL
eukprot:scaffold2023_cov70-Phaeocystis_antarctica.AAC.4